MLPACVKESLEGRGQNPTNPEVCILINLALFLIITLSCMNYDNLALEFPWGFSIILTDVVVDLFGGVKNSHVKTSTCQI